MKKGPYRTTYDMAVACGALKEYVLDHLTGNAKTRVRKFQKKKNSYERNL